MTSEEMELVKAITNIEAAEFSLRCIEPDVERPNIGVCEPCCEAMGIPTDAEEIIP